MIQQNLKVNTKRKDEVKFRIVSIWKNFVFRYDDNMKVLIFTFDQLTNIMIKMYWGERHHRGTSVKCNFLLSSKCNGRQV